MTATESVSKDSPTAAKAADAAADGSAAHGKPPATLLVVDDDPELLELTEEYLSSQGFEVLVAEDGVAMDAALQTNEVDLMILDLMLPGEDGLSIARRMRRDRDLPIIIVSAQGDDVDRIVGLEIGADDYLAKPFNPRELLARVRAVLRRGARREAQIVTFGDFELNLSAHRLTRDGRTVALTSGEFELLDVLVRHPNTVLDRDRILDLLTGTRRAPFDRSIDVRVTRLRSKIEPDPATPVFIKTIWGKGYMFCPGSV